MKAYKRIYHKHIKITKHNFYTNRIENATNKTIDAMSIVNVIFELNITVQLQAN